MAEEQAEAAAPAKKGGGMTKKIVIAVVVLAMAGGGAWWMMRGKTEAAGPPPEPGPETRGLVAFEPFLVNLADQGGTRFLKLNLQLVVADKEAELHIMETPVVLSKLRSAILELLTQQEAGTLVTTDGKAALKALIKEHANRVVQDKVIDVLFAEFVVQF